MLLPASLSVTGSVLRRGLRVILRQRQFWSVEESVGGALCSRLCEIHMQTQMYSSRTQSGRDHITMTLNVIITLDPISLRISSVGRQGTSFTAILCDQGWPT